MTLSNPSPLRTLFLTEAILKVLGGATFILFPSAILRNLTLPPYSPISTSLVRSLGTQTVAFSIPLFLAARSDAASVKSHRLVYWTLLAREGFLALGLLGQIIGSYFVGSGSGKGGMGLIGVRELEEGRMGEVKGNEVDRMIERRRLRKGLWLWIAELVPFVVGRVWILGARPEWFYNF